MAKLNRYRFSLGDSNTTGFGVCFTIEATTEETAIANAQRTIDSWASGLEVGRSDEAIDVCVYVGPDLKVTADDIDDVEETDEDED
jgi:hypothetical protein